MVLERALVDRQPHQGRGAPMVGDQRQHDGGLVVGIEVGPVQGHQNGGSCADDVGHPAGEDGIDVDLGVGKQAVDLLGGMLGVQAAGGGEAPADRADRKGTAAQHAERRVAERGDALGVQVVIEHAAQDLAHLVDGEPLSPDNHGILRPAIARLEICRIRWCWKSPRRIRKDMLAAAAARFFMESLLSPRDSFVSQAK